jgi:mannose-6-phosphate isomerase-like protein (cupin superfamily)
VSDFERTGEELGTTVSVIGVHMQPGGSVRLHRHAYDEVFVVLEGEATFTLGDEEHVVRPPEVVVAPAGVPHGFRSTGDVPLRQVDVHVNPVFKTEWLED